MPAQAAMKMAAMTAQKAHACPMLMAPVTRGRPLVRGFSASMRTSAMRLKVMAKERTATMARVSRTRARHGGSPRAASTAPAQA